MTAFKAIAYLVAILLFQGSAVLADANSWSRLSVSEDSRAEGRISFGSSDNAFTFSIKNSIGITGGNTSVEFQVIGKTNALLFKQKLILTEVQTKLSVGQMTIDALSAAEVPFEGEPKGIEQIFGLGSVYELTPDKNVKYYGWCFRIDDVVPNSLADEVFLSRETKSLTWFYAYAIQDFKTHNWSMCVPAE